MAVYAPGVANLDIAYQAPGGSWQLKTLPNITDGVHHGMLRYNVDDYGKSMVAAGMATVVGTPRFDYMSTAQTQAEADNAGLWSTCADFGA